MKVLVADNAGACYGVSRSLDLALQASHSCENVATLGELIHNPLVVKNLKETHNVSVVNSVSAAKSAGISKLIIRSHGVPIDVLSEAKNSGIEIIDATCPFVRNVQSTASLLAGLYSAVIIIGSEGHPEVQSVASYIKSAGSKCFVIETIDEAEKHISEILRLKDSVGVVSQTTQSIEVFENMVAYFKEKGVKLEVENTICAATRKRQASAAELSKKVDSMIVIGGHNSSNTNHLAALCRENCSKVYHIESNSELNEVDLTGINKLGITAGASTPRKYVEAIVNILQNA